MHPNLIKKTGYFLSITLGIILLVAAINFIFSIIWPEIEFFSLVSSNWLIKIFSMHSKITENKPEILTGINFYDIGIIILFLFLCLILLIKFKNQNKIGFFIAISLLILGLILFILTKLTGRSTFMASGLIISIILVLRTQFKIIGLTGIIANIFLLIGDFTVGSNLKIFAFLFGIGYLLQVIWILMISKIFRLEENRK